MDSTEACSKLTSSCAERDVVLKILRKKVRGERGVNIVAKKEKVGLI